MSNVKTEKKTGTVMYSQLQPWSTGILPCMEQVAGPPFPARVGEFYETPRPHSLGYEVVEATPLPAQHMTNLLVDACRTSYGLATEPLKFPNLVTGFDRNPLHAARAALYTRYTPYEWVQNEIKLYNEANANRSYSEKLRKNTACFVREADEEIQEGQIESGRKLGERITFWRNEVTSELERFVLERIVENDKMQECRRGLQIAIQNLEGQLHIAQECLYHRESRKGIDLVHDEVEKALLKEVETVRNCEKKLEQFMDRCINQLTNGRAAQHQLQIDVWNKKTALGVDSMCNQMNNFSRGGLQYYGDIEKYDSSVTETDAGATNSIMKKLQMERAKSHQLRNNIDNAVNIVGYEMCETWTETNKALDRRIAEMLEAKEKLQMHLHMIQKEIFDVEKNMVLMQKTIADKSSVLKVAHTRLETRAHSPETELCKDQAQLRMIKEVGDINKIVYDMNMKLQQTEAQHQQLLRTRFNLESNLQSKIDALFIDSEKCMGLRRSCPISSTVK